MFKQLSLFETTISNSNKYFDERIRQSGFDYEEIDIGDITFKTGQLEPIHRWYRLTPSYSPNLVRFLIKEFQITPDHFVVDPFSGRGTTCIECQKQGIRSLGIEINPLLQQTGTKSLKWETQNLHLIQNYLAEVSRLIQDSKKISLDEVIQLFNTRVPIIYNVFRWWEKNVLKELIICREVANNPGYSGVYDYLWLALNKTCLDCANIHRNHPTITFDDHHQREIDVFGEMSFNLNIICSDLRQLSQKEISLSELSSIVLGDSTNNLKQQVKQSSDFIITSPPYPNRYSYVHQTRPQLHFMELFDDVKQATEVDLQAVGGTWGRATSILQNKLLEVPTPIKPYLCYYDQLKIKSTLMCNYATKYFINMWQHIKSLHEIKSANFRAAYIVGNSRLSGVEIFTESILAELFKHEGFYVEKVVLFRKRGGRKNLYETAIFVKI
ncbi:DNA methyltransferase [Spirulina subsalsa]|uniref:DNA methyltransferase n=1 Tax=Spirulina subsalsa TaxID=54311 RepID=UPI0002F86E75|nr:DNA methyltransferase [Spirulina subsalsa]